MILFIVHPEEDFSWDMTAKMINGWLDLARKASRVIILASAFSPVIHELDDFQERWNWKWYTPGQDAPVTTKVLGWASIPEELRSFKSEEQVLVVGGNRNECLSAWEDVLSYVGIRYEVVEELTYERSRDELIVQY